MVLTAHVDGIKALNRSQDAHEDEDLGLILLCSIPTSFANFRDTILYNRDKLTLHEIEKMKQMLRLEESLLDKEQRKKKRSEDDGKPSIASENSDQGVIILMPMSLCRMEDTLDLKG
ncbi:hypothetical protein ACJX0J_012544, partial [Zea mays]